MPLKNSTDETFKNDVLEGKGLILVDFWAEWCGPCRMLSPTLEAVATEMEGKATIIKINIDENPESPSTYGVRSIPALMLFKEGALIDTKVGVLSKDEIIDWLNNHS